jgi:hypothetical protein
MKNRTLSITEAAHALARLVNPFDGRVVKPLLAEAAACAIAAQRKRENWKEGKP